jgi:hypothetical protein
MDGFLLRSVVTALGLLAAALLIPGIRISGVFTLLLADGLGLTTGYPIGWLMGATPASTRASDGVAAPLRPPRSGRERAGARRDRPSGPLERRPPSVVIDRAGDVATAPSTTPHIRRPRP